MNEIEFKDLFLTSEYIKDILSEEEIFEFYLHPVDFTLKYTNPYRIDNHPDCNYYISKSDILYFVDHAINKYYNCFDAVMQYYRMKGEKCTYRDSLRHIYEDMIESTGKAVEHVSGTGKKKRSKRTAVNIKIKVKNFTPQELAYWNVGGVISTQKDLNDAGIYSVETLWEDQHIQDNLKFVFAYIEQGRITQIYFSKRKKGERRFINTSGFIIGNLKSLKHDTETLIITKSKKDVYFLSKFGVEAIYTANEKITIDQELYERILAKYSNVYTLMDKDIAGFRSATRHKRMGIEQLFVPEGKDFTEWLELAGYQSVIDTIELIKQELE